MSTSERVTVPFEAKETFSDTINKVYERISAKAFEYYLDRGAVDGYDLDDWIRAENTLIQKPHVTAGRFDGDVVIELTLPNIHPEEINLQISSQGMLVYTMPDADGRQIFRSVHFAEPIDVEGVEAEYMNGALRVTAAVAGSDKPLSRSHVA
jgi:HSP20 family molecular chaperone IbpA